MRTNIPKTVADELKALRHIASKKDGPIADTYDRLQGIVFLRAAQPGDEVSDFSSRLFIAGSQSRALLSYNIAHLFERVASALNSHAANSIDLASSHIRWIHALLKIMMETTDLINQFKSNFEDKGRSYQRPMSELALYKALSLADDAFLKYESKNVSNIINAIGHHNIHNADGSAVHNYKLSIYLIERIAMINIPLIDPDLLNEDFIEMAVHKIDTKRPSYLMQFRLLHQVPELLGAEVLKIMNFIKGNTKNISERLLISQLLAIKNVLNLMSNCLWPLVELMIPSEYYQIRRALGVTSGSKSKVLAKGVLRSGYIELAKAITGEIDRFAEKELLIDSLKSINEIIRRWRDLHMFLPWSILGTETTSLIGSNATVKVDQMAQSFRKYDPLNNESPLDLTHLGICREAADLFANLTGGVTRRRFPDVERRAGIFARRDRR
jgi:hypothetical protein